MSARESDDDPLADSGTNAAPRVDSMGLAYAARGGRILVSYPAHDPGREGSGRYDSGFDIGPIPPSYWNDPPNEVTRERAGIWRALLESDSAASD
jgi:hypothetical protein